MPEIDLNSLDLTDLKKLQRDVGKAIESFENRRKTAALTELESKAREMGFSLAELTGAALGSKSGRQPGIAKYRNPADPGDTWSGRGRKPRWFTEALAAGKSPEDLLIAV